MQARKKRNDLIARKDNIDGHATADVDMLYGRPSALCAFQAEASLRPISILTGNGGLFLDFEMERGADGAMTGYAFPDMLVQLVELHRAGKRDEAHDLFDAHLPLLRYEQQQGVGLAVRK